jgi:hypothetical protein
MSLLTMSLLNSNGRTQDRNSLIFDDVGFVWSETMSPHKTTLERAFELARSGEFGHLQEITHRLRAERYDLNQMFGRQLTAQLRSIMAGAKRKG